MMASNMDVLLWIPIGFILCVLLAFVYWLNWKRKRHQVLKNCGYSGPKPDLIYGNYYHMKEDRVNILDTWIKKYGPIFGFYLAEDPYVCVADLHLLQKILVKEANFFINRPELIVNVEPYISSLLCLAEDEWKNARKCLSPAFSSSKMRNMMQIMNQCTDTFMEVIEQTNGKTFDMVEYAQGLTLDVIFKCALAVEVDCQRNRQDPMKKAVVEYFANAANSAIVEYLHGYSFLRYFMKYLYQFDPSGKRMVKIRENLYKVIALRRSGQIPKQPDMLQLMINAVDETKGMDDKKLVANCFIFLVAGFETTATALSFITHLLAKYPEHQEKTYRDIVSVLGDKNDISYEDIQEMKYLDMFVSEAMRLYPPVILFVSRKCNSECEIDGYKFPKDVNIMVPVWHIHHNPEYWPEPEQFRPERFSAEEKASHHPMQYLPFGQGPRICIGMRFALLEAKLTLIKLLRKFKVVPGAGFEDPVKMHVPSVFINPINGISVKLEPRT